MYVFISFVFFLILVSLPDDENEGKSNSSSSDSTSTASSVLKDMNMEIPLNKKDFKKLRRDLDNEELNGDSILNSLGKWNNDSTELTIQLSALDSLRKLVKKGKVKNKDNNNWNFNLSGTDYKSLEEYDSIQNALAEGKRDGWFERTLEKRNIELNEKYKGNSKQLGADFMKVFTDNFSKVLFWLLPVFALLLKLLYVRRDFYYSEHLVFTIYYYNFFFLSASVQLLVNQVAWLEWLGTLIGFWIFFYLLFAMKRMYLQRWGKTISKFLLFSFLFMICLTIALGISAMAALLVI
jgi:hypothetical protein